LTFAKFGIDPINIIKVKDVKKSGFVFGMYVLYAVEHLVFLLMAMLADACMCSGDNFAVLMLTYKL